MRLTRGNIVLILLIIFASQISVFCQDHVIRRIDSLVNLVPQIPDDSNKVNILCGISNSYWNVSSDEGLKWGNEALALAEKLNWKKGISKACKSLGSNYWAGLDYVKAQEYYLKALKLDEEIGDKRAIASSLHSVGVSYSTQPDKSKAIQYFTRALHLYEEIPDSVAALGCHLNIGEQYEAQGKMLTAFNHFNEALTIAERTRRKRDHAYILYVMARGYAILKDTALAIQYEEKSLSEFYQIGSNNEYAVHLGNAGDIYNSLGHTRRTLASYKEATRIFKPVQNIDQMACFGSWYGKTGRIQLDHYKNDNRQDAALLNTAISNLNKALQILSPLPALAYNEEFNNALSEAYALKGNFREALDHARTAQFFRDSLLNTSRQNDLLKLELEYLYSKKRDSIDYQANLLNLEIRQEKQLNQMALSQQWQISMVVLIVIVLVISFLFFLYRIRQLRLQYQLNHEIAQKKIRDAEFQRQIKELNISQIRSQMNPHFIFNSLNTIQSFIYSNDKKSASQYLGKFSELIRKILYNSQENQISLREELNLLHLYLDIEEARFGESLKTTIEIDHELDIDNILIHPMLLQTYVENALKHGLLHLSGEKKLRIRFLKSLKPGFIDIFIEDNGIGRQKSHEINKNRVGHHSFANAANQQRIDLINELNSQDIAIKIIDKKNPDGSPAGTTISINLPLVYD